MWRLEGKQYHDFMIASHVVAGVFNSQRSKASDQWFTFPDLHPAHSKVENRMSGDAVNRKITHQMEQTGTVEWLEE